MSDVVKSSWNRYVRALQTNPVRTKALTSGVVAASSNLIAQKLIGAKKLNYKRAVLFFLYGFCHIAPLAHFIQKFLDRIFKGKRDAVTVLKKIAIEQFFVSPYMNFMFMLYYGIVVEGMPWRSVKGKIKKDYPSVQRNAWKILPIVAWINHRHVPLHLRALFPTIVGALWSIFLNVKAASLPILDKK